MVYTSHYLSGNLVDTLFCQSEVCVCMLCPFIHQREKKKEPGNHTKYHFFAPKIVISYKL